MCNDVLKEIVLAKLLYASPAWWGFATTSDKQHIEAFIRRGVRLGLYGDSDPTPTPLAKDANKTLFERIGHNKHYVLQQPSTRATATFDLDITTSILPTKTDEHNVIARQLFANIY